MLCCNLTERAEMFKELTIRSEFYCVYSQCELTPGDYVYNCFKNYVGKKKNYLHFQCLKPLRANCMERERLIAWVV